MRERKKRVGRERGDSESGLGELWGLREFGLRLPGVAREKFSASVQMPQEPRIGRGWEGIANGAMTVLSVEDTARAGP